MTWTEMISINADTPLDKNEVKGSLVLMNTEPIYPAGGYKMSSAGVPQ